MKKHVLISIFLFVAITVPFLVFAQPADPSDVMVPIDGGLSILLGAAAAYGSHKIQERRKRKNV